MAKKQKVKEKIPTMRIDKNFIDTYYTKENLVPSDLYKKDENVREELRSLEYKIFKEKNPTTFSKIINFGASTIGKVIKFNINKEQEKKIKAFASVLLTSPTINELSPNLKVVLIPSSALISDFSPVIALCTFNESIS